MHDENALQTMLFRLQQDRLDLIGAVDEAKRTAFPTHRQIGKIIVCHQRLAKTNLAVSAALATTRDDVA